MITVLEIRDNIHLDDSHPSAYTMDVLCSYGLDKKWMSVPYELLFDYIFVSDKDLKSYFEKFNSYEEFISELYDIGYNLDSKVRQYIDLTVTVHIFETVPSYDPDFFSELDI